MGNLGAGEIILIVIVILIFFGPKKIPEIAQGIGKGMREFKKAMSDVESEIKNAGNTDQGQKPNQTVSIPNNSPSNSSVNDEQTIKS